jgi:hypothetical protein
LDATQEEMDNIMAALQQRELAWEVARQWESVTTKSNEKKRLKAETKMQQQVGKWLGNAQPVTPAQIESIIARGENP